MILHTCKTMTVRQYCDYESGNVRALYRWPWRWLPLDWFADDKQAFIDEFNSLYNQESDVMEKAWEQLDAQNRVMLLQSLAEAIYVHTVTRIEMKLIAEKVGYKLKEDEKLMWYLERVRELTGTEIKDLDDIYAFRTEVQRKIDKYNEKYNRPKIEKKTTMFELFTACCKIMEVSYDYTRMTLWEFAQFKRQAEQHTKLMEAIYNKNKVKD